MAIKDINDFADGIMDVLRNLEQEAKEEQAIEQDRQGEDDSALDNAST